MLISSDNEEKSNSLLDKPSYNKQGVHKQWQPCTRMNRGTICVEVHPFRILPFKGNKYGLIPIRPSFCFEIKKGVCNSSVESTQRLCWQY